MCVELFMAFTLSKSKNKNKYQDKKKWITRIKLPKHMIYNQMELITLCPNLVELFMWAKVMFAGNNHEHHFSKKKNKSWWASLSLSLGQMLLLCSAQLVFWLLTTVGYYATVPMIHTLSIHSLIFSRLSTPKLVELFCENTNVEAMIISTAWSMRMTNSNI